MSTADWVALGFLLVAIVASGTVVGLSTRRLWRAFGSLSKQLDPALDGVTRGAAAIDEKTATLTEKQEHLARAAEHLRVSIAQLQLLQAAANEVQVTFNRFLGAVPSK